MTIDGTFYSIEQRDREDGIAVFYIIPRCSSPHTNDQHLLRCMGKIKFYSAGDPILLNGEYQNDTFVVTSDRINGVTHQGIDDLLHRISSRHLKGKLTEAQINQILTVCKEDLFSFCSDDKNIPVLNKICRRSREGETTVKRLIGIIRSLALREEFADRLLQYGVPYDRVDKMINSGVTLQEVRENPYIVFSRYDVPLAVADKFAFQECQMQDYSYARCTGFVLAGLRYLASCGNTCCTMEQLISTINGRYRGLLHNTYFGPSLINACILSLNNLCSYCTIGGISYIYLNTVWAEEASIAFHLRRLIRSAKRLKATVTADDTAEEIGITYNSGQRQAFDLLKTTGVKILTGPPGSGKTAAINGLIQNFEANGNGTVHLAATTGMAARVMHDATGRDTETVHAMLHVVPYNNSVIGKNLNDPVDADLIIVDEISMIGTQLFSILVGAARSGSLLLLVGDENQLQSVDYGNVLHDLIASGEIEVCRLTEILRQSGTICTNAARVNAGKPQLEQDATFTVRSVNEHNIQQLLAADYDPAHSQIISPMKSGPMGTVAINKMIQSHVNGNSPVVATYGKRQYRAGDKIIMTKNNFDRGYINGDIGFIKSQDQNGDLVTVFPNGTLLLTRSDLCNMDLAYAITVHKSQGSEFSHVHILLPKQARLMMTRRLLYTAITRAKKRVTIYNQGTSLADAIANRAEKPRTTMLAQSIQGDSHRR